VFLKIAAPPGEAPASASGRCGGLLSRYGNGGQSRLWNDDTPRGGCSSGADIANRHTHAANATAIRRRNVHRSVMLTVIVRATPRI